MHRVFIFGAALLFVLGVTGENQSPPGPGSVAASSANVNPLGGGTVVPFTKYPYMAKTNKGPTCYVVNKYFCVSMSYAVDIAEPEWPTLKVYTQVPDATDITTGIEHIATKVVKHPNFDIEKLANNIGVIKVCPPFETTFVTLPPKDAVIAPGTDIIAAGYSFNPDADGKRLMRELALQTLTDAECDTRSGSDSYFVPGTTLCSAIADAAGEIAEYYYAAIKDGVVFGEGYRVSTEATGMIMYQPFSVHVDWIKDNTKPL